MKRDAKLLAEYRRQQENPIPAEPVKERRAGTCHNCGGGSFGDFKIVNHNLLRTCKRCGEVFNTDKMEVVTHGSETIPNAGE